MSTLKKVTPLSANPEFVTAFANIVAHSNGKVCSVCGLSAMGHGRETVWLGHISHSWDGVPATTEQLLRAEQLTVEAIAGELAKRGWDGMQANLEYVNRNICTHNVQDKPGFIHFVEYHLDNDLA